MDRTPVLSVTQSILIQTSTGSVTCVCRPNTEDTCEACRAFRSKKTLRDQRPRRLQMASKPKQDLNVEEEERNGLG
ncbi:hypothetical protein NDU88_001080 [Pleurodeles waltl]|uniref:Uncharacterized protein n=1 Tax=Pleurodeles waltl TaxID=8319 RepID=A0AAV7NDQ8_PLEWA|nr:hypothetical protein NDU88_001080 [Pleurodeles waltl]